MTRRKRHWILLPAVLVLTAALAALNLRGGKKPLADTQGNGLFSWHDEVFVPGEREALLSHMEEQGLTELYQDVPHDLPVSEIRGLMDACRERGIRFFLLVGQPDWALDPRAEALRGEIQRAALLGCDGLMVDIEPGGTAQWHEDRDAVMADLTAGFLCARAAAGQEGLELIVCLSWYYDDYGYADALEEIVAKGCDALAVMNYNREDEAGQIATEAALCRSYGKPLINIYELKEPGSYDLEEIHTYRTLGLEALWQSWEQLQRAYPDQTLCAALHDYRELGEMCAGD